MFRDTDVFLVPFAALCIATGFVIGALAMEVEYLHARKPAVVFVRQRPENREHAPDTGE